LALSSFDRLDVAFNNAGIEATGDRFTGGNPEVLTSRIPLGRAATAEEVASAAVWLAAETSRFVSGVVVPVHGGATA